MHDDYTRYIYVSTIQIKRPFFYFYACTCTFDYMNRSCYTGATSMCKEYEVSTLVFYTG